MKKSDQEITDILVAYDATGSVYAAAEIADCDPKTVRRYVDARRTGRPASGPVRRTRLADAHLVKIDEWVSRSHGRISARRAHHLLLDMGFTGSERTTRRAVAEARKRWRTRAGAPRPWVPEPGLWAEFGWAGGPLVPGPDGVPSRTTLFCGWLAWSRFLVVLPCRDHAPHTLLNRLDRTLRALGGAPTYLLSRAGWGGGEPPPGLVAAGPYYGVRFAACAPHRSGTGRTPPEAVPVGPADLLPAPVGLPDELPSFARLEDACGSLAHRVNEQNRPGPGRNLTAYQRLGVERHRLHPLPPEPFGRRAVPGAPGT
jgi:hypothetical protein